MQTRENFTLQKTNDIEQQILIYLSTYYEKYEILNDASEDLEFDISYFMIEKDLITVNLNFYTTNDEKNEAIWLYKKQVKIESLELLERIEILSSYE